MIRGSWLLAVVAVAACGGREPPPSRVELRPRIQLLGCSVATPAPILADDGVSFGGLTKAEAFELHHPGSTQPSLDVVMIGRVIRTQLPALQGCYAREFAVSPGMTGGSGLVFTIEPDGHVSSLSAGTGASATLSECLSRVFDVLLFPRPTGGATIRVAYPFTFAPGAPGVPPRLPVIEPSPHSAETAMVPAWSPYALDGTQSLEGAAARARTAELAVRARLDRIDACFAGPAPTGSMRAMLVLDASGALTGVRVGGLGDHESEFCVRAVLGNLHVPGAARFGIELACDLARGDAQRWRLALDDYEVITASATQLAHDGLVITAGAADPAPLPANKTYAIVMTPETPGTLLELALTWANDGDATLVALASGPGAPVLLGSGRSTYALGDAHDDINAVDVTFEIDPERLNACFHTTAEAAPLSDHAAVHALVARLADRCRTTRCASTVGIAVDGATPAKALVGAMDEVRRAGFERALIGGGLGCRVAPGP